MADETPCAAADAMPVEIVQFCWKYNLDRLQNLPELAGGKAKLRMAGDKPYVTDNSNYIVDLYFEEPIKDAQAAADTMSKLTGGRAAQRRHSSACAVEVLELKRDMQCGVLICESKASEQGLEQSPRGIWISL